MKKIQMMILAAGTGLFLSACGGSTKTEEAVNDEITNAETTTGSLETTYTIDPGSSLLLWQGDMMGMYSHEGTLSITSGTITITEGSIISGAVEVDMNSITPTDDNYPEDKPKEKLVGHLSSEEFFDTKNYPTASVVFNDIVDGQGKVDLTIRGITNSEEVHDVYFEEHEGSVVAKATISFDRSKYNVSFVHPMEEMVVSNDIKITVKLRGGSNDAL